MDSCLRIPKRPAKLPLCPVCDVLRVRALAEAIVDKEEPASPFRRDARLILTAAWLHLQADAAAPPTLPDLQERMARVAAGLAPAAFWASGQVQILRYAGVELAALDQEEFKHAIEACIGAPARRTSELDRLPAPRRISPRKAVRRSNKRTLVS